MKVADRMSREQQSDTLGMLRSEVYSNQIKSNGLLGIAALMLDYNNIEVYYVFTTNNITNSVSDNTIAVTKITSIYTKIQKDEFKTTKINCVIYLTKVSVLSQHACYVCLSEIFLYRVIRVSTLLALFCERLSFSVFVLHSASQHSTCFLDHAVFTLYRHDGDL